jgi:hypothetical protein
VGGTTRWEPNPWEPKTQPIKTFRKVSLSLNPDSSKDHKIKVKRLPDIQVGDFAREEPEPKNCLGSLIMVDMIAVKATQVKYAQKVAKRQAKHIRKVAKNSARVKTSKAFPEYTDQTRLDYDPYSSGYYN